MNMNPVEILATIKDRKAEIKLMEARLDSKVCDENYVVFLNNANNLGMQAYLNLHENNVVEGSSEFSFDATLFATPKFPEVVAREIIVTLGKDGLNCSIEKLGECMTKELALCDHLIEQGEQYVKPH